MHAVSDALEVARAAQRLKIRHRRGSLLGSENRVHGDPQRIRKLPPPYLDPRYQIRPTFTLTGEVLVDAQRQSVPQSAPQPDHGAPVTGQPQAPNAVQSKQGEQLLGKAV